MTPKTQHGEARALVNAFARACVYGTDDERIAAGDSIVAALSAPSPSPAVREALAEIRRIVCREIPAGVETLHGCVRKLQDIDDTARSALSAPSQDPIREAAQRLLDKLDTPLVALEGVLWIASAEIHELRSALSAPSLPPVEAPCSPTLTECPRCKNAIGKCDGLFAGRASAPVQEGRDTVPWPVVTSYSGGASHEGIGGRVWIRMGDGAEVEYAPTAASAGVPSEMRDALTWIMRSAEAAKEPCGMDPDSPAAIRNGKFASIAHAAAQGLGIVRGPSLASPPPAPAIQPLTQAGEEPARVLHSVSSVEAELLIQACVPGGNICDPQEVADNIRRYLNQWPEGEAVQPATEEKVREWISVDERLPPAGRMALCLLARGAIWTGWQNGHGVWETLHEVEADDGVQPTHWMPLPEAPSFKDSP